MFRVSGKKSPYTNLCVILFVFIFTAITWLMPNIRETNTKKKENENNYRMKNNVQCLTRFEF